MIHEKVNKEFEESFKAYEHPFQSSDEILNKKEKADRQHYMELAKLLEENPVFQQELTEWKRCFYNELALRSMTDIERTALRQTLIAIQAFEKRIHSLSMRGSTIQNVGVDI